MYVKTNFAGIYVICFFHPVKIVEKQLYIELMMTINLICKLQKL